MVHWQAYFGQNLRARPSRAWRAAEIGPRLYVLEAKEGAPRLFWPGVRRGVAGLAVAVEAMSRP